MSLFKDSLQPAFNTYANKVVRNDEFESINNAELKKIMTETELADFEQAHARLANKSHIKKVYDVVCSYFCHRKAEEPDDRYASYFHRKDDENNEDAPFYNSMSYIEAGWDLPYETLLTDLLIQKAVTAFAAAIVQSKDYREDVVSGELKMRAGFLRVKHESQQLKNKKGIYHDLGNNPSRSFCQQCQQSCS